MRSHVLVFPFALALLLVPTLPAGAVTITVTATADAVTDDDQNCTLREALKAANLNAAVDQCPAGSDVATDEIVLPAGTFTLSGASGEDFGDSGDLDVLANTAALDLIVTGAGRSATILQACDANQKLTPCPAGHGTQDRVFNVRSASATFRHLTVRNGNGVGGAIYAPAPSDPGPITVDDCTLADNASGADGGAISSSFAVVVTDSTFSGNAAFNRGGAIFNDTANVTITRSTFSGNSGAAGGALCHSGGTATISNSTFSGNTAAANGGGILSVGTITIENSTVTENHASNGQDADGGGVFLAGPTSIVRNSIIAGNVDDKATNKTPDCHGTLTSQGHNVLGIQTSCAAIVNGQNGDRAGTAAAPLDALLKPLLDNGGPTKTHEPRFDSPAVGSGNPAAPGGPAPACPAVDQRGVTRPQGATCDSGAVETTDVAAVLALDAIAPATGGTGGTVTAVLTGDAFAVGTTVKLVRAGAADIPGIDPEVSGNGALLTTTFDLTGAAPGAWSVVVTNPDATTATLPAGFLVQAGGAPDLWVELLARRQFRITRQASIYLTYGNRGTVDAVGVPIWVAFPKSFLFALRFLVEPPPVHPDQVATDWGIVAVTNATPEDDTQQALSFLLPLVPAGYQGVLEIRVRPPIDQTQPFEFSFDLGEPYFTPQLSPAARDAVASEAEDFATAILGAATLPERAVTAAYVSDQLNAVRSAGLAAWRSHLGAPPVYSLAHLVIDAGQFAADAGGHTFAAASAEREPEPERGLLAAFVHHLGDLVLGLVANARPLPNQCRGNPLIGECNRPPCAPGDAFCQPDPPQNCSEESSVANCNPERVPAEPVTSRDPNDKVGPGDPGGIVARDAIIPYAVFFENVASATAPAQEVVVTDQLDTTTLDLATFMLGAIAFGDTLVMPPPASRTFTTEVDLRPDRNLLVRIEAGLDDATGLVTWRFTSLDPATGELPDDPLAGFLPPNATPPEGDGSVLFTVAPKAALPLGTEICNDASIVFDVNAPIATPEWCNVIGVPPSPEDCENCADDDGDGKVDRADDDCPAPANGAGAGVAPDAVKPVAKCAKALRKTGAKLASTRTTQIGKCLKATADCVQLKPGDAACVAKATAACTKAFAAIGTATTALRAALTDQCGPAASALGPLRGFGYDADVEACAARGVPNADTLAEIVDCVGRRQACVVDRAIAAAVPRAAELLAFGGRTVAIDAPCLPTSTPGSGSVGPELRKAIRKCDGAVQKATAKLVAARSMVRSGCAAAVATCVQEKSGDAGCVTKARKTCGAGTAKLAGLDAALAAAVTKACGAAPLTMSDLVAPSGLAASALATRCARLGVGVLATPADLATCLAREGACRADQSAEASLPRFREYLTLGGVVP